MNKNINYPVKKINSFISDIPINEESRDNLFSLATSHDLAGLEHFITTNSISLNVKNNNNQTIIHVLLETNSTIDELELLRCIKFLIDRGAHISSSDKFLLTPLFICIKKNYFKIFNYLLEKDAYLEINTYDKLTILHEISKPKYITFNETGIKDLIPERLPKTEIITKYNEVYEKILKEITDVSHDINFTQFINIAKEFYINEEDFNNVLLVSSYEGNIDESGLKNDLFEKLKNKLQIFYNDDDNDNDDNNEEKIKKKLDDDLKKNIIELNNNINHKQMQELNTGLFNAIKNFAQSLELSIHYFFLKDPVNSYIATDVVIAIAEASAAANANAAAAFVAAITQILRKTNVVREVILAIITISKMNIQIREPATIKDVIDRIQIIIIDQVIVDEQAAPPGALNYKVNTGGTALPVIGTGSGPTAAGGDQWGTVINIVYMNAGGGGFISALINLPTTLGSDATAIKIELNVRKAIESQIALSGIVDQVLVAGGPIQGHIQTAATHAATTVRNVDNVGTETNAAFRAVPAAFAVLPAVVAAFAVVPGEIIQQKLQVIAILQAATRAAVYGAVYVQNKVLQNKVANISAVHAAVDASVIEGVINGSASAPPAAAPGGPITTNQDVLQRELTNEVVAIEAVIRAASEAIVAITAGGIAPIPSPDEVIEALEEALVNIDADNKVIEIIIELAKKTVLFAAAAAPVANQIQAIIQILIKTNIVKEIVLAVKEVSKISKITQKVIDRIQKIIIDQVIVEEAAGGALNYIAPGGAAPPVGSPVLPVMIPGPAAGAGAGAPQWGTVISIIYNNAVAAGAISILINMPATPDASSDSVAATIYTEVKKAIENSIAVSALPGIVDQVLVAGGPIQGHIQTAATHAATTVRNVDNVGTETNAAFRAVPAAFAAVPGAIIENKLQVIAILQAATRAAVYGAVYVQNKVLPNKIANISAVHAAVDASVIEGVIDGSAFAPPAAAPGGPITTNQDELQRELTNEVVAIEAVIRAASEAIGAITAGGIAPIPSPDEVIEALKEALKLPPIIPNQFINSDYNKLIKLYNLMNIPQKYINYNNEILYSHPENYTQDNIKYATRLTKYKLPEGNRCFAIDYFNLLYTFNEYVKNNYIKIADIDENNIFILYKHIQQIYKYNYIINIFEKEKEKIKNLLNFSPALNDQLKKYIKIIFDERYKELEESISNIRKKLETIEKSANRYINLYNIKNGLKVYDKSDEDYLKIGIYPKINFPTEIKYSLADENAIITRCKDYTTYNNNKNDFFHNFVLFFQDIGSFVRTITLNVDAAIAAGTHKNLLNNILINYDIDITKYLTNNNNKCFKLYISNPKLLKLEKQKIRNKILKIKNISDINFEINTFLKSKEIYNDKTKIKILNEILNNKFDNILNNQIDRFFKENFTIDGYNDQLIENNETIVKPDFNAILLNSLGFEHILIPNYEFVNNKFLSINGNKYIDFYLYFDTNYFKPTDLKILKYYNSNQKEILTKILDKKESLLFKTDIKGWTPIYYAIDGNNYDIINEILKKNKNTLKHYDNKGITPIQLCINKQLHHLTNLFDDKDDIYYLTIYTNMLRNELKSNDILIPVNIESVFIIALAIQNYKFYTFTPKLPKTIPDNTLEEQYKKYYVKNLHTNLYLNNPNKNYNKGNNENDNFKILHNIFDKFYDKAIELESKNFELYGSYWKKFKIKKLEHIKISLELKKELENISIESKNNKFNIPNYDEIKVEELKKKINTNKKYLDLGLKFINTRFDEIKNVDYVIFLDKIYVHVLANIIGVNFYLTMEELIVKHYINSDVKIEKDKIDNILKLINNLLINNKLEDNNINYSYIKNPIPESVLKDKIKEILKNILFDDSELINNFETIVLPRYRDLYKITYKYLKMFMSNYHKFIYNQYHGLDILLLLLNNLEFS